MPPDPKSIDQINGFLPWISERIKGQREVLAMLDEHFGRSELGLTVPNQVRGAFLFVGPTGVGKTETTLRSSEYWFGPGQVARFDMAEFKSAESLTELRARLARAHVEQKRFLLLDEIEKAHWEVLDLVLQLLDHGAGMTAPDGRRISFADFYLVMTSNLGAREAMRSRTRNYTSFSNTVVEYVRRYLRPDLLGRIEAVGQVAVFRRLEEAQQRELATFHTKETLSRLAAAGHHVQMDPEAAEFLIRRGFSDQYGARPLLGTIQRNIEGAISRAIRQRKRTGGKLVEGPDGGSLLLEPAGDEQLMT